MASNAGSESAATAKAGSSVTKHAAPAADNTIDSDALATANVAGFKMIADDSDPNRFTMKVGTDEASVDAMVSTLKTMCTEANSFTIRNVELETKDGKRILIAEKELTEALTRNGVNFQLIADGPQAADEHKEK
jgi:hypothetical protein